MIKNTSWNWRLRISWLYLLKRCKIPCPKKCVCGMKLNCVCWWGNISANLENVSLSIFLGSLLPGVVVHVRSSIYGSNRFDSKLFVFKRSECILLVCVCVCVCVCSYTIESISTPDFWGCMFVPVCECSFFVGRSP